MSAADVRDVPVHYDFASSICYVAHRVMQRIEARVEGLGIALHWTPVDLSTLLGHRRGEPFPEPRREHARRVAADLGVALRVPRVWLDSREAAAAAIASEPTGRGATVRERIFTAVFEEGRGTLAAPDVAALLAELDLELANEALQRGREELLRRTREAARAQVTGVPTFMLGRWPMGGIQSDDTMTHLLGRFVRRAREGRLA